MNEIKLLFRENMNEYLNKIKKNNESAKFWSISRLNTFNQCKRSYYYTYIDRKPQKTGVYSTLGTACHSSLENLYEGKDDKLDKTLFDNEFTKCELFGIKFPNSKYDIKGNYKKDIDNFYKVYKKRDSTDKQFISELGFVYQITDNDYLMGYIDLLIMNKDGSCDIVDFKTSSSFDKNHTLTAGRQLILYKLAIEQLYNIKVNSVAWEMLKYATVQIGTNKPKIEIKGREWVKKCASQIKTLMKKSGYDESLINMYLLKAQTENNIECLPKDIQEQINVNIYIREYDVADELVKECKSYIKNTINEIYKMENDINKWNYSIDKFFCNNLCGFGGSVCKYWELDK